MLYTNEDYAGVRKQTIGARILMGVCLVAALLGGLIPMILLRNLVLSVAISTAVGLITLFLHGIYFGPVFRYGLFVKSAQENIRRSYTGRFISYGDISWREGVRFIGARFLAPDQEEPFLCYIDYNIPLPDLTEGKLYLVTHTGNSMLAVEAQENGAAE